MEFRVVTNFFAGFVKNHGFAKNFKRFLTLDSIPHETVSREMPALLSAKLKESAVCHPSLLLKRLYTHEDGLSEVSAAVLREELGPNLVDQDKPLPWWQHLWLCYRTPFDLLLTFLAIISYVTEDLKATIVISSMVVLSVAIRFWQEKKSSLAADKLKAMVSTTATVMRRHVSEDVADDAKKYFEITIHVKPAYKQEIPMRDLVPGDIVLLSAGDMIPADCRVLIAKDLFVSQAAMTGESLPLEKYAEAKSDGHQNVLELDNILFMGTNVVSGTAKVVVLSTGNNTYFGMLAQRVTKTDRAPTQFQAGVNKVAWILIRFMFIMTPLVLLINGFTKGDWMEAALFAMSVAVGLTPEMLPMIVTSTLAKGAVVLSRQKVIVKRLDAIQNFGAMDILCTDKTGTLTQDKIFLARHTDVWGNESEDVLEAAYLNSFYQTGLKNLLDEAVLEHKEVHEELNPQENYAKIDEIPFDFVRRRMSVVVANHERRTLICKGALEEILSVCTQVRHGDQTELLTESLLSQIREITGKLNEDGLRVVAVASREFADSQSVYGVKDESSLTLVGYVAFLDPPKESTQPALEALSAHGVKVKVLTGDNELVTTKICKEVGLHTGKVILGSDIEDLSEAELKSVVEVHDVFAKLTPAHKERIVRALKDNNHVVGFMGDGINDAPALRTADIGISVDTAVDIAKEAADIILLEKSLMVLEEGVIEGRKTFANMLKYIKMTASSNFGNVFSVLIAGAFIPFLPMLPMQLLVQNLLYDFSQVAIPFDNVDEELVKSPQKWNPTDIGRFMIYFGPVSSVFDITTYAVMWFIFGANSPENQSLFQSGWFVEGLMTQTLVVHMIRTRKIPFIQSRPAIPLLLATISIMGIGIFLPMGPYASYFRFESLPMHYFGILAVILIGYMVLTQCMKSFYARKFGWQ